MQLKHSFLRLRMSTAQNKYTSNQQFTFEPNQRHEAKRSHRSALSTHLHKVTLLDDWKCLRFFFQCFSDLRKSQEICRIHKHYCIKMFYNKEASFEQEELSRLDNEDPDLCWPCQNFSWPPCSLSPSTSDFYHLYICSSKLRIYMICAHIHTPPWNSAMSNSAVGVAKSRFR